MEVEWEPDSPSRAGAPSPGASYVHAEEEFLYVVEGRVHVDIGGADYVLSAGESAYYGGGIPHRWWSADGSAYRLIVVKQAPPPGRRTGAPVIDDRDYLQLLPKTELHCHFVSTMSAPLFIELAERHGVTLPSHDPATLFDFDDSATSSWPSGSRTTCCAIPPISSVSRTRACARRCARATPLPRVLRQPQYFAARGLGYDQVIDPVIAGLREAEARLRRRLRIVVAINRRDAPEGAVELVRQIVAHGAPEVVGLGQDDLTPRTRKTAALPRRLRPRPRARAQADRARRRDRPRDARGGPGGPLDLRCDRLDHGYRIVDDPGARRTRSRPRDRLHRDTAVHDDLLWMDARPGHRIRRMIDAGLTVAVFDRRRARCLLPNGPRPRVPRGGSGRWASTSRRRSASPSPGVDASFCDDAQKERLRADFHAQFLALDALLAPELRSARAAPRGLG